MAMPEASGGQLGRRIEPQSSRGCPPDFGESQQFAVEGVVAEMVLPAIRSWMKQADRISTLRIRGLSGGTLVDIARAAGQCPVALIVGTALGRRDDVLDLETEVERLLRSATIFAALAGAGGYGRVTRVHTSVSLTTAAPRSPAARVSSSMS